MCMDIPTLLALKNATINGDGFLYLNPEEFRSAISKGIVEINPSMVDGDCYATRITPIGIDWLNQELGNNAKPVNLTEEKTMSFEIYTAPMPASKARGRAARSCKYPFEALEVGQMFFVPATEEKPEPWRTMASIVSDANRRYAVPGETTRINRKGVEVPVLVFSKRFIVREFEIDGQKGAGVWREK